MAEEVYEGRVGDLVRVDVSSGQDTSPASKYVTLGPGDNTFDIKKSDLKWKPIDFFVTMGFSSQDSLVYSGFSTTNYIVMGDLICPNTKKWTLNMKVTTGTDVSTNSRVISVAGYSDMKVPVLGLTGGKWKLWLTSNGSSWDIANGVLGSSTVATSTTYYLKLAYDGSSYTLKESTNGSTFTTVIEIASSTPIYGGSAATCIGATKYAASSTAQQTWLGSIDLSGWSYVEDDGYKVTFDRQVRYEDANSYLSNIAGSSDFFNADYEGAIYFNSALLYLYGYYNSFNTLYKIDDIEFSVTGIDGDSSSDNNRYYYVHCSLNDMDTLPRFIYCLIDVTGRVGLSSSSIPAGVYNAKLVFGVNLRDAFKEMGMPNPSALTQMIITTYLGYAQSTWNMYVGDLVYNKSSNSFNGGNALLSRVHNLYSQNNYLAGAKYCGVVGGKSTLLENGDASITTGTIYTLSAHKSISKTEQGSDVVTTRYIISF